MNFDLSGLDDRHRDAPTKTITTGATPPVLARAGASANLLASQEAGQAEVAASLSQAAATAAAEAGVRSYAAVEAYKTKWGQWLQSRDSQVNLWFLASNVLYIALGITTLALTLIVVHEHVDDFKRNEFTQHTDVATGVMKQYAPCGMPTPDSMYLLQALGAVPAAGWDGAALEPDYQKWMKTVDRALCARVVPGADLPGYYAALESGDVDLAGGADATHYCNEGSTYTDYGIAHAEELLALGFLLDDSSVTPSLAEITAADVNAKHALFELKACLEKDDGDTEHFYSKQQRDAYGDLKTRVARAYLAAMPAFSRYQNERATCQVGESFKDPFGSLCKHSCHVREQLRLAAAEQALMYNSDDIVAGVPGEVMASDTSFTKQLYRLLALSLAGYYDRYHNDGVCFRNSAVDIDGHSDSALQFCKASMKPNVVAHSDDLVTGTVAMKSFSDQNHKVEASEQCGSTNYPPPPPAPPIYRSNPNLIATLPTADPDTSWGRAYHVCAMTLQYGLFEQGRLFGIPDVIQPFVVDNRADRSLHFIGEWIYNAMYVEPMKKAGDILSDPKSKLELYIAYRLSSTSIWAILVANVAGFMLVRAALPMAIWFLSILGVRSNNVAASTEGEVTYEAIALVRPLIGYPIYAALFVNALIIYWIFWLDPATQSHYYVSTECDDWKGLGVQVPSGAFATTWGKRRYGRFGEHVIGILMIFQFLLVVAQRIIGHGTISADLKKQDAKVRNGETARLDGVAFAMIGFALCVQILFIAQSIVSGDAWYQAIKASDNDKVMLNVFSKDVIMSVWAAFWTSTSIAWFRQKWAVQELTNTYQYAWMATCILTLWLPVFQSAVLLEKEIDAAFSDGKGTTDTPRLIIYIFIYATSVFWTGLTLIRLKAVLTAMPDTKDASETNSSEAIVEKKKKGAMFIRVAERARAAHKRVMEWKNGVKAAAVSEAKSAVHFDLSGMNVRPACTPVALTRKPGAVYMPLLPAK